MTNSVINPYQTFRDSKGIRRAGGFVTFFVNNTTTLGTIYSDEALSVPQSNPYQLNAAGQIEADVKYQGLMTMQVTNSDGSDIRTTDNVITTNASDSLRDDLASTAAALGKSLVQGSFIDSVNTVISASTYTVTAADRGTLIEQTSVQSTTVTLLAAAVATEGFTVAFRNNSSTGIWTIVGDGGEQINGGNQVILVVGEWCILVSDGTGWRALISNEPHLKEVTAVSSNTVVDSGDKGLIFDATGNITVTTPPAATVTEGFSFTVRNAGTGIVNIDGNLSETINGAAIIPLTDNRWLTVVSDGANWSAIGGSTSAVAASTSIEVFQVVNVQDGTLASGTTVIPIDDTIPQSTEGDEYMSLSITPNKATNNLKIEVVIYMFGLATTQNIAAALFQDDDVDAIAAVSINAINRVMPIVMTHWLTAGTTSSTTFKVRAGPVFNGPTLYFNGTNTGPRFGGVMSSTITITEYTT